jgi:hypothetical protein
MIFVAHVNAAGSCLAKRHGNIWQRVIIAVSAKSTVQPDLL